MCRPGAGVFEQRAEAEQADRQRDRHQDVETVQQLQLGELQQVADAGQVGLEVTARQEPAHVAPDEAALDRRVNVVLGVRERVVMTVVRSPPDRAALHGWKRRAERSTNWPAREVLNERCEK